MATVWIVPTESGHHACMPGGVDFSAVSRILASKTLLCYVMYEICRLLYLVMPYVLERRDGGERSLSYQQRLYMYIRDLF